MIAVPLGAGEAVADHCAPSGQQLNEVREQREAIQALAADESEAAQSEKRRLLEYAEVAMRRVKLVADACVGAHFAA